MNHILLLKKVKQSGYKYIEIANILNVNYYTIMQWKSKGNIPNQDHVRTLQDLLKGKTISSIRNVPLDELLEEIRNRGYTVTLSQREVIYDRPHD